MKVPVSIDLSKNIMETHQMIEIENEKYSEEYVKKAIIFYEDFQRGKIAEAIKEGLRK